MSKTVLILKYKGLCVWLLFLLISNVICKWESNPPKNVFRGLKIDLCHTALKYMPSLSFQTRADLDLIGFSLVTSGKELQN